MGKLIGLPSGVLFLSLFLGLSTPWFASAADPIDNTTSPIYPRKNTTLILIKDPIYGTRNVSYWVTDDKLAIIDGDVIYGSVDDLLSHSLPDPLAILKRTHSIRANTWPSATITYKFDSDATQTALGSIVNTAIDNWKKVAPYLKFTKVPLNSAVGQNGVVTIKAPACGGCNSAVGFVNAPMTMRLQVSCTSAPGKCGILEATHEFGHLLGEFTLFSFVPVFLLTCVCIMQACIMNIRGSIERRLSIIIVKILTPIALLVKLCPSGGPAVIVSFLQGVAPMLVTSTSSRAPVLMPLAPTIYIPSCSTKLTHTQKQGPTH